MLPSNALARLGVDDLAVAPDDLRVAGVGPHRHVVGVTIHVSRARDRREGKPSVRLRGRYCDLVTSSRNVCVVRFTRPMTLQQPWEGKVITAAHTALPP
jgi:hypothetical protein